MLREVLFFLYVLYLCPKFYYIFTVYLYVYYVFYFVKYFYFILFYLYLCDNVFVFIVYTKLLERKIVILEKYLYFNNLNFLCCMKTFVT